MRLLKMLRHYLIYEAFGIMDPERLITREPGDDVSVVSCLGAL